LTFRYEKLHKRHKDLQQKINGKIYNDMHNVKQVLGALASESESKDIIDPIQYNINTFQETKEKEKEKVNSNITNIGIKENKKVIDYKIKASSGWYASLLMYNSY